MSDIKTYNIGSIENAQFIYQSLDYQALTKQIEEKKELISLLQETGQITRVHQANDELDELENQKRQLITTLQEINFSKTEQLLIEEGSKTIYSDDRSSNVQPDKRLKIASQDLSKFQVELWNKLAKIDQNNIYENFPFTVIEVNKTGEEICRVNGKSKHIQYFLDKNSILSMVIVPNGDFLRGSTEIEAKIVGESDNSQQLVNVDSFCLSRFPITKRQWSIVAKFEKVDRDLKVLPCRKGGYDTPITNVSWLDTIEFCKRLSQYLDVKFRLPTEIEWEYACRAGTQTPFHFGPTITTELANYDGNYTYGSGLKGKSIGHPSPINRYEFTNSFGLTDMHGNVYEWCVDKDLKKPSNNLYKSGYRLLRGGSWNDASSSCRSAYKLSWPAQKSSNFIGFRVASNLVL